MTIATALDTIATWEGPATRWLRTVSENKCPRCGEPQWRCVCADPENEDLPEYAGAFEAPNRETEQ